METDYIFQTQNAECLNIFKFSSYTGNMGNLLVIVVLALCQEQGSPFGETSVCKVTGRAYASFSLAVWF